MNHIKAIAFDLGGVIFTEGKTNAIKNLKEKYSYDERIVAGIFQNQKATDLRKGLIDDDEFWQWAKNQLPPEYDAQIIKQLWYDGYVIDEAIISLVKKLQGHYQLIIFSGNIKSRIQYLEQKYNFRHFFNLEVYSFEHGATKPETKFFDALINKSNLQPAEIVIIDDFHEVATAARQLGINALLYETGAINELEDKLQNLGVKF